VWKFIFNGCAVTGVCSLIIMQCIPHTLEACTRPSNEHIASAEQVLLLLLLLLL
jgi:hypothetical protein